MRVRGAGPLGTWAQRAEPAGGSEQAEGQAGPSAPPAHPVIKRHDFLTTPMKRLSDGAAFCHLTLRITHRGPTRGRAPSPGTLLTTAVPLGPPGSLAPGRPQPVPAASVSAALQGAPHAESPAATPPAGPGTRSCPPSSQADGVAEVWGGAPPRPRSWALPAGLEPGPCPLSPLVRAARHCPLRTPGGLGGRGGQSAPERSPDALGPRALQGHRHAGCPVRFREAPLPQLPRGRTCTVTPGKRLPESPPSC